MSRRSTSTTGSAWAGSTAGADIRRSASAESKAWLGAVLQTVREGSSVAVQSLLADLRANGHIVPMAEADMVDDVERPAEPELDAEIDLGDEDDVTLPAWDESSTKQESATAVLGQNSTESDGSAFIDATQGVAKEWQSEPPKLAAFSKGR
jgi:hypothetical protein